MTAGTFLEHVCPAVSGLAETREGQDQVDGDVPSVRGKTGCFRMVLQQSKVVGCCPRA